MNSSARLRPQHAEPSPWTFGAIPQPDGRTCFRLWAPQAQEGAMLEIEDQAPVAMRPAGAGFLQASVACPPGARYRYRLEDGLAVPDPASRLQDGDVHDASIVVGPDAYAWQHPDWQGRPWSEAVIYEVHAGLAAGYAGLAQRLPALAELGITVIELMPIADFPGARNWGYDGVLPFAPDTRYGTPDELKRLIDQAHGLGMCVMLDVVYNHFGPDGNYLPQYAPAFFRDDVDTPWGTAIDFRQPAVRRFFIENALYWLTEFRFDGLRLDAVHAIEGEDWLLELARELRAAIAPPRQIHLVLENDRNRASLLERDFDAQWNDDGHHTLHCLLTGESYGYYADYAGSAADKLARCLASGFAYQGEASVHRGGAPRGQYSGHLPPTAFVLFLQNHDQTGNRAFGERLTSLLAQDAPRLRAAIALQLLAPQIPLIFMGEEIGSTTPFLYFTGHTDPELAAAVTRRRRREFAQDPHYAATADLKTLPDPQAERSYLLSRPWPAQGAAVRDSDAECNDDAGRGGDAKHGGDAKRDGDAYTPEHWSDFYRDLLHLRRRSIVPWLAGARSRQASVLGPQAVWAQWILSDGSILSLYANLDSQPQVVEQVKNSGQTLLFESAPGGWQALQEGRLPGAHTIALIEPA